MSSPVPTLGQTSSEVMAAFHHASLGSYPTVIEARDQIGCVYRWCPDVYHRVPTLGRVQAFNLIPLTDADHASFEAALTAGRIRIVETRRSGYERVLHAAHAG